MNAPTATVLGADAIRLQEALSAIRGAWIAGVVNVVLSAGTVCR